jgi:uracil-DNA glycosylase family 4
VEKAIVQYLSSLAGCGISELPLGDQNAEENLKKSMAATQGLADSLVPHKQSESAQGLVRAPVMPGGHEISQQATLVTSQEELGQASGVSKSKPERLKLLDQQVKSCTRCSELVSNRTQTVFGSGNPDARLCFMGEAPGAEEDIQGEPFVGAAGQLLTRIIQACKMERQEVYVLNTLKCRPPKNRNPAEAECADCRPFLDQQLEIIAPEFICCLGGIAAKHLLDSELSVGRLRGKLHNYQGIKVVVTYHPAYLLRNPDAKREVWNDMKFLMNEMGHDFS